MKRIRIFTDEEMKELLKNPNIIGIKNKSQLIYKNSFKYWAVMQKLKFPEKTAKEIFTTAGLNVNILSDTTPRRRIHSWVESYKRFGVEYFKCDNKYRYSSVAFQKDNNDNNICYDEKILINELKKYNLVTQKLIILLESLIKKI